MQLLRKPLLVAAAATALIGGGAWAASAYTHHLQVKLPDGEIAQVDYVGDVAPRVVLQPVAADAAADPFVAAGFPAFGQMDRIFADMERQQAAMMQQVAAMEHNIAVHGPAPVATGQHPGMANWSYVSSTTTSNGCTQTVQWSSSDAAAKGAPAQPQVIRTSSGNCDKAVKDTPVHQAADVKPQTAAPAGKAV
jgi:hypothetical protein